MYSWYTLAVVTHHSTFTMKKRFWSGGFCHIMVYSKMVIQCVIFVSIEFKSPAVFAGTYK
jgi:hypothetical protein